MYLAKMTSKQVSHADREQRREQWQHWQSVNCQQLPEQEGLERLVLEGQVAVATATLPLPQEVQEVPRSKVPRRVDQDKVSSCLKVSTYLRSLSMIDSKNNLLT